MAFSMEEKFQRELNFAVIDEVDSILIDEARTPLIISGQAEDSSKLYMEINKLIPQLELHVEEVEGEVTKAGHYTVDEKTRQVELNEAGHQFIEDMLTRVGLLAEGESLYSAHNLGLLTHVYAGLRAHKLFNRNIEYIVQDGQVVLVDEHTGRTMPGRRLSEGLHQAIEAKEGLNIQAESQTLASTTFQNYFRLYTKLSGMTGTADTEAFEFHQIYGLEVMVIPPNKPLARKDFNDLVFLTAEEKYAAIVTDIKESMAAGRPVLVGTATIETSEHMSALLVKEGIEHKVLNAKFHEKEAEIIAQAGRPGALTIATNMAGRGTDILLGGNWEVEVASLENPTPEQIAQIKADWQKRHQQVLESGGLQVIASERHESRRIDNQLRGRAGRQGDAGSSRFYLSLEDSLMRIFASDRVKNFMKALGMQPGEAIEHRMVTNAIEKAQRKVEGRNFDIRKQLLEFDDVNNEQRKVIYHMRNTLLAADNIGETIADFRQDVLNATVSAHIPPQSLPEQWDVAGLEASIASDFGVTLPIQQWLDEDDHLYEETLREKLMTRADGGVQRERRPGRCRRTALLRETNRAARAGRSVERPPVDHGSPASRHPPAWLRPEEPEAGIQARVVHAVLRAAGFDQARLDPCAVARSGSSRRSGSRRATSASGSRSTGRPHAVRTRRSPRSGATGSAAVKRSMWPSPPPRFATSRSWAATNCATAVRARNSSIATGRSSKTRFNR